MNATCNYSAEYGPTNFQDQHSSNFRVALEVLLKNGCKWDDWFVDTHFWRFCESVATYCAPSKHYGYFTLQSEWAPPHDEVCGTQYSLGPEAVEKVDDLVNECARASTINNP